MKIREGQCHHCRIAWAWSRNITLKEQKCGECGRPLIRLGRHDGYTWLTWEGYTPSGKRVDGKAQVAA